MAIIPVVRCRNIMVSVTFYTQVLDFRRADEDDTAAGFAVLTRAGDLLFLSAGAGDGEFGQAVVVMTEDIDQLFGLELGAFDEFGPGLAQREAQRANHHHFTAG